MARWQLSEFRNELINRGFDGFENTELNRYINWGYREIARLTKWAWEETDVSLAFTAGQYRKDNPTSLPTAKAVLAAVVTTANYEGRLKPMDRERFYDEWAPVDPSEASRRSEPSWYYWTNSYFYVLPAVQAARTVVVTISQQVTELTADGDVPITPEDYDEAILLAGEIRCHYRARQPDQALESRRQLTAFFDDALDEETTRMTERVDRVRKGADRWL